MRVNIVYILNIARRISNFKRQSQITGREDKQEEEEEI